MKKRYYYDERPNRIKELSSLHRTIMGRLLLGEKRAKIAKDLRITQSAMTDIINSPLFVKEFKEKEFQLSGDVSHLRDIFKSKAPEIVERETTIALNAKNESVSLAACKDILDRVGLSKEINVNFKGQIETVHYSDEELRRVLLNRLSNSGVMDDDVSHDGVSHHANEDVIDVDT